VDTKRKRECLVAVGEEDEERKEEKEEMEKAEGEINEVTFLTELQEKESFCMKKRRKGKSLAECLLNMEKGFLSLSFLMFTAFPLCTFLSFIFAYDNMSICSYVQTYVRIFLLV